MSRRAAAAARPEGARGGSPRGATDQVRVPFPTITPKNYINLIRIVQLVQPDEIYNLGAQGHVAVLFECPEYTADADGVGTLRLLEAIRILKLETLTNTTAT